MRKRVWLAQQALWDMEAAGYESIPLACGYLKAFADADPNIRAEMDVRIFNFGGHDTPLSMIKEMFGSEIPDVLACSIFGWNFRVFGRVAEAFRQFNPSGWVIMGGTHVTDQAERVYRTYPSVDIVVNGEGEVTFRDLLRAHLDGRSRHDLPDVEGISYKTQDGQIITTNERPRIVDLDSIPSPFLSGAIELTDQAGRFKYDVVLMETNRGCPYKCAFCYWGGAIGQKLRSFSLDRLREEIDLFGRLGVEHVCLCDANFGMTKNDEEFVEILIRAREKYGVPRTVVTSWAKNKGKPFYRMVTRMQEAGFHSSFTLALQTLTEPALKLMGRDNMKINDWEDMAYRFQRDGLNVYGELIWGCPGETYDSFLKSYDRLSEHVSRIAVYPLLLLPNTDYSRDREKHGFRTWRGMKEDFEYILSHNTMTLEDNERMLRFLFWARVIGEHMVLRHVWAPLRKLAGISQSEVLLSLDRWFDRQADPLSEGLKACRDIIVDNLDANAYGPGLHYIYRERGLDEVMHRWWIEEIEPRITDNLRCFLRDLFRYDWATRPYFEQTCDRAAADDMTRTAVIDGAKYRIEEHEFNYDIPELIRKIVNDEPWNLSPRSVCLSLYYKLGFGDYIWNHEFFPQFCGMTKTQLEQSVPKAVLVPAVAHDRVSVAVSNM